MTSSEVPTWGVVPTKNRHDLVRQLIRSCVGQVRGFVVVDNNDEPDPVTALDIDDWMTVVNVHHPGYPPNISELLNVGLDALDTEHAPPEWNVALLNDDVIVPPGWVKLVGDAMRATTAALAYVDRVVRPGPILFTTPPLTPFDAATVCACVVRGELRMRFDETMRWWYSDTDLDFRCRQTGGVLAVPGETPPHLHPSEQTMADAVLSAQTHRDRETFDRKWAGAPW